MRTASSFSTAACFCFDTISSAHKLLRLSVAAPTLLLGGCLASSVQTSSGSDYLARTPITGALHGPSAPTENLDEAVRRAAAVEPTAHFPMKICLARIDRGGLSEPPPEEMALWASLGDKLGPSVGEFAILNPLIASFAATAYTHPANETMATRLVADIRLGAAREHCDTAFIYEPRAAGKLNDTPLQLLNWTIVGYFIVPSTGVQADGTAEALLVDVRTGYPYAQLTGASHNETFTAGNTRSDAMRNHEESARLSAIADLIKHVPETLETLRTRLAATRVSVK